MMVLSLRRTRSCVIVVLSVFLLCLLIISGPLQLERPCPALAQPGRSSGYPDDDPLTNCAAIFANDPEAVAAASGAKWCVRRDAVTDADYVTKTRDCDAFIQNGGYMANSITDEEENFPLAFSILMHEHVEQMERLLRAIYRPQNYYCIHVDLKASSAVHKAVYSIASCLPNVHVASRLVSVSWAEFTVLEAEIICMEDLLQHEEWKYFINLSGREFPIRTNWELVRIFKAYNGANEIDGTLYRRPLSWTKYMWRREYWRSWTLNPPAPHGFQVAKGSMHIAASRAFVHFALHNGTAKKLLEWTRHVRVPDEHFFATLNHNPHMGVPGAYTENPDLRDGFFVRLKIWQDKSNICNGKWSRHICKLGVGDLHHIAAAKHMFVNKFDLDYDPLAFQCMEQWYTNRTRREPNKDFDINFYSSRKLVRHHS